MTVETLADALHPFTEINPEVCPFCDCLWQHTEAGGWRWHHEPDCPVVEATRLLATLDREPRGISAIIGAWPGDETDEELLEALRERETPMREIQEGIG